MLPIGNCIHSKGREFFYEQTTKTVAGIVFLYIHSRINYLLEPHEQVF